MPSECLLSLLLTSGGLLFFFLKTIRERPMVFALNTSQIQTKRAPFQGDKCALVVYNATEYINTLAGTATGTF
jgi:hypothetical protein